MKDIQRTFYIAAIVGLSFLLLMEYQEFKLVKQEAAAEAIEASSASETNSAIDDSNNTSVDTDNKNSASTNTVSGSNSGGLIEVHTDVLNLLINTKGGDIVELTLNEHQTKLNDTDKPYKLLYRNKQLQRTYISTSGLLGANGIDGKKRPVYSVEKTNFTLAEGEDSLVVDLNYSENDVNYIKRFSFSKSEYLVDVQYIVTNNSQSTWRGKFYGAIRRDGLKPLNEASTGFGMQPYLGAAITTGEDNYKKIDFGDIDDAPNQKISESIKGGWITMIQHYFISAWVPNPATQNKFQLQRNNKGFYILSVTMPEVEIEAGASDTLRAGFYAGPKDIDKLEDISENLDLTIDFGWLWWIAKPLFYALDFIHGFVGNWGLAIIVLTFFIKLLFFPLSAASYRSMAKMRKVGPQMKTLKERFGDDRQKMSQEMMKLYKKEKVNPLGGCLPILIQMPVFIALYYVLMESVELRHAPFVLWLQDLSTMDPYFILPLIMGATMYIQQQLNPTPPDPTQAKIMKWMPVLFTFMFLWFPSGLVLYWVVNNTLSIIQQYVITKQIEAQG